MKEQLPTRMEKEGIKLEVEILKCQLRQGHLDVSKHSGHGAELVQRQGQGQNKI